MASKTLGLAMTNNNSAKNCKFDLSDNRTLPSACVNDLLDCKTPEELYNCMLYHDLPLTEDDAEYIFDEVAKNKRELLNIALPKDGHVSKLSSESLETIIGGSNTTAAEKDFNLKEITENSKDAGTKKKKAAYYISRPTYCMGYGLGVTAKCVPLVPMVIKSMVLGFKDQLFGISD